MIENGPPLSRTNGDHRGISGEKLWARWKVNVNTAEADEIGMVLQLTPAEAKAIVQYRKSNGHSKI